MDGLLGMLALLNSLPHLELAQIAQGFGFALLGLTEISKQLLLHL